MTEHILENIRPKVEEGAMDRPWWMGNSCETFTVKSAYEWWNSIWNRGVPFKINFLLWRSRKGRIATEDNLQRMRISMASRCYCCNNYEQETMIHLFLTAPIAIKLWKQFATCAGIKTDEGLQQILTR
ncbi:hypothetical protein AABB24_038666 [Solanum stoloniferum]|uniref:Reverse transcriptase zinc-binding domain-containing protein n=1 Tax=Solanum stoloniferum TaxID=62892 RepID=A0ABD2QZ10_9SOLN